MHKILLSIMLCIAQLHCADGTATDPVFGVSKEHDLEMAYKIFTEKEFCFAKHDGAIIIMRNGTKEDKRFWDPLITALKLMGPVDKNAGFVCTRGHIIGALKSVTGCNELNMVNAEDWVTWLKDNIQHDFNPVELK